MELFSKKNIALAVAAVAAIAAACAQTEHVGSQIKVSSVQLQPNDKDIDVAMQLDLADLQLPANAQLVLTPSLTTTGSTRTLPQIVINGRRQSIMYRRGQAGTFVEGTQVVTRKNGTAQTVEYHTSVPNDGLAADYQLDVREDLCGCHTGKGVEGSAADEVDPAVSRYTMFSYRRPIATSQVPVCGGPKIYQLDKRAYIDFPVDRTELYADYRRNPEQLDSIVRTINTLKADRNLSVKSVNIHGFASPESPYAHNEYLAKHRAETLTAYVQRMVNLPASIFTVSSTPEDWEGLRDSLRANAKLPHRDDILAIAEDEGLSPDAREAKIKKAYPEQYDYMLKNWYPALRHSDYHIVYEVRSFSLEEAREVYRTKPAQLSLEELYMLANSYPVGSTDFNDVMETALRLYPQDEVANLNAACVRLNAGRADEALPYLERSGSSAETENARGVYCALREDISSAKTHFQRAADMGLDQARKNLEGLR